jgi:hypothetical protein
MIKKLKILVYIKNFIINFYTIISYKLRNTLHEFI